MPWKNIGRAFSTLLYGGSYEKTLYLSKYLQKDLKLFSEKRNFWDAYGLKSFLEPKDIFNSFVIEF